MNTEEINEILRRVAAGMTTAEDADRLREIIHEAWRANLDRTKPKPSNVVPLPTKPSGDEVK